MRGPESPPLRVSYSTLEFVPIGPRDRPLRVVPRRIEATGGCADLGVSMTVETDKQGASHVTRLELGQLDGGPPVTSAGLRALPIARLVREALDAVAMDEASLPGGIVRREPPARPVEPGARTPRRGALVTDEHLRDVAARYRAAIQRGEAPTKAVADELYASRPTAARWIARARERGFLGASLPGRAGEREEQN